MPFHKSRMLCLHKRVKAYCIGYEDSFTHKSSNSLSSFYPEKVLIALFSSIPEKFFAIRFLLFNEIYSPGYKNFITARVRSTREGNVLTRVCPSINLSVHRGGGVPISHNALQHFPECHEAAGGGGVPRSGYPPPPGGVPG